MEGTARRPRVLIIADYPYDEADQGAGGLMQSNYRLVEALRKSGEVDLHVLTSSTKTVKDESASIDGARIVYCAPRNHGYDTLLGYRGLEAALRGWIDKLRPDIIHAQGPPTYIRTALRSGLPCVVTIHGIYANELKVLKNRLSLKDRIAWSVLMRMERHNLPRIRNLIAITSQIEDLVRSNNPSAHIYRLNNPLDENFFTIEDTQQEPVVLFVGWLINRKGLHVLLEAMESLVSSVPGVKARIVGSANEGDSYVDELTIKYKDLINSGTATIVGSVTQEQLYDELSRCSVLCLPSLAESAPMVISQAMAAGKPVVSTRVGGIPEMVEEGVTGKLCAPGDASGLANALSDLLNDEARRMAMGAQARLVAIRRYKPDAVAQSTIEVYRDVLARDREPKWTQ
jgi:glycosyltransferase involved in cell wall biosynthesis